MDEYFATWLEALTRDSVTLSADDAGTRVSYNDTTLVRIDASDLEVSAHI